jgi:positive phototaxis protein PixI
MNGVSTALPTKQLVSQTATSRSSDAAGEMFLRFKLDNQTTAVVPMQQTQEALILPAERVSVVPNLPASVLGLFNRRSSLLWLVDLPQLVGLEPIDRYAHSYELVLLKVNQTPLAVAVRAIQGVVRLVPDDIKSPIGSFNPAFTPYLRGWILKEQELVLVLDPEAIINTSELSGDRK